MAGTISDTVQVQIVYREPWDHADAERLIRDPMMAEMSAACEQVAEKYRFTRVDVTVV